MLINYLGGVTMKQLFSLATVLLFSIMLTSNAFAHSQIAESIPANNEVVTEPLNKIVLTFEGQIEQGSLIEVTSTSGQAIDIQDITIGEGTLTGTVANPLPNDDYQVNWSIISADGHPLEGEFTFTVDVPVSEPVEEVEEMETTEVIEGPTDAQLTEDQEATPEVDDVDETSSSSMTMIVFVLIAVVLAVILFFIFMKRKKK
ncbi:LPXTG cell wall anchor domain-containing protein [Lysinibacillus antri]|uniref:LPXTG cell wall anchor domain-containing protein n=2 Tax=Lysinibacillus antri TaxID=2498145 RepID=A0A3S0P9L3_9BACI|nr:LPXTG cell wall anchor domain-containing protein [Lysinibacillus antri]